jgi:glutamate synthase (NADPH/NADH) large chain
VRNLVRALGKGVLKVMSKMGVSTVASYTGAQIFEALGLSQDWSSATSPAPPASSAASGLDVLAEEVRRRHAKAYPTNGIPAAPPARRRR